MTRRVSFALCWAGLLLALSTANADACRVSRQDIASIRPNSTKNARLGCAQTSAKRTAAKIKKTKRLHAKAKASTRSLRVFEAGSAVPKGGGHHRLGNSYVIAGRTYVPRTDPNYRAEGKASWYGKEFHGKRTANGELFDMNALSAAHPTLPLPSYVRVTNLNNHRSVVVRLNDRGPYRRDRLIDLSVRAAKLLGFYDQGVAQVRVEYVGSAELAGSNDEKLAATLRDAPSSNLSVASTAPVRTDTMSHLTVTRSTR